MRIIDPDVNYVVKLESDEINTLSSAEKILDKLIDNMGDCGCSIVSTAIGTYDLTEIEVASSLLHSLQKIDGFRR